MPCSTNTTVVTDNTPLVCEDYISDQCIVHNSAISFLSLAAGSTQLQINDQIVLTLINAINRISALETLTGSLQAQITALQNP